MKPRLLRAACAVAASYVAYERLVRPWAERWGATDDEVALPLPGDDLVAEPAAQVTRAITVDAPVGAVWPWLVQIGAERGGFYSYDWLENLFGLGIHSSDVIVPEWQTREVGDLVCANRAATGGWYVVAVHENDALVLSLANLATGRPTRRDEALKWEFLWTFALRPGANGTTRLLVRERTAFANKVTRLALAPIGFVSFVMTRKMLIGIKERAEATAAARA